MQNNSNVVINKKKVKKVVKVEEVIEPISNSDENMIFPDRNWDDLAIGGVDVNEIIQELVDDKVIPKPAIRADAAILADDYQTEPIVVIKKKTYTQAHRRAQQKYREKYPEKYHSLQRKLYQEKIKDDEWKKEHLAKGKVSNGKYRERKRQELIDAGVEIKPRGRPRKVIVPKTEEELIDETEPLNICFRCQSFVNHSLDLGYCRACSRFFRKELEDEYKKCESI
jgi:hypothetical protein